MLTIQHNYWADLAATKGLIDFGSKNPTKAELYKAIASYLGIDTKGLDTDQLWAAIDERNMDLACAGVAESCITNESTVLDQMAAAVDKPVLRRDRKPVERPKIKSVGRSSVTKPVLLVARSPMAKALKMALN